MSTGPTPYNSTTHPIVRLDSDWNRLLEQDERSFDYIVRVNGAYYEGILGSGGSSGGGTIAFGGSGNAGATDGTSLKKVLSACVTAVGGYGSVYVKGNAHLLEEFVLNLATGGAVRVYFDDLFIDADVPGIRVTSAAGHVWTGEIKVRSVWIPTGYTCAAVTLENVYSGRLDVGNIYPSAGAPGVGCAGIKLWANGGNCRDNVVNFGTISDCYYGLHLCAATATNGVYFNTINGCNIKQPNRGVFLDAANAADTYINANTFNGINVVDYPKTNLTIGFFLYNANPGVSGGAGGNTFFHCTVSDADANTKTGFLCAGSWNNYFYGCETHDFTGASIDIRNDNGTSYFFGGQFSHLATTAPVINGGTLVLRDLFGFTTENSGSSTLPAADWSIDVTHGLNCTPTEIVITPRESSTADTGMLYVDTIGATTFRVNARSAVPGVSNLDFMWQARKARFT